MKRAHKDIMLTVAVPIAIFGIVLALMAAFPVDYRGEYSTYHYHEGRLVAWNQTRCVFYVETETKIWTVDVDDNAFRVYAVGDWFTWTEERVHEPTGITNLTVAP